MDPSPNDPKEHFVGFLEDLARAEERGPLARLHRGLGREECPPVEMLRVLLPHLYLRDDNHWQRRWYFVVASLFALHPESCAEGNFGDTFRRMQKDPEQPADSDAKRFTTLLDSDVRDLPHRLRQAVSLARARGVPVNWRQLLGDLLQWDQESRFVQYRWARAFWGRQRLEESTTTMPAFTEKGNT